MAGKDETPHEIVHGNEGKATLEHTQHEAPMPKHEKGDGIDLSKTSSKPQHSSSSTASHDQPKSTSTSSTKDSHPTSSSTSTSTSTSTTNTSAPTGPEPSHGTYAKVAREAGREDDSHASLTEEKKKGGKGTHPPPSLASNNSEGTGSGNKFEQIDRENAEKFGGVNLEDEGRTGQGKKSGGEHESKSGSGHEPKSGSGSGQEKQKEHATKEQGKEHGEAKESGAGNKFDLADRDNAEKFGGVNLSE